MDLTLNVVILTLLSGSLVGLSLSALGAGGSILCTPLLVYLVGIKDMHVVIGTSAAAVGMIALCSLAGHWREGRVLWPHATSFTISGLSGAIVGSSLGIITDGDWLLLAFSGAMFVIGLSMLKKSHRLDSRFEERFTARLCLRILPVGFCVGVASGFFGIGGGFLIVPALIFITGMSMSNAAASSLLSIAIFGLATSGNYAVSGVLNIYLVLLLFGGGAVGVLCGLRMAKVFSKHQMLARNIFALMVCSVAIYIVYDRLFLLTN